MPPNKSSFLVPSKISDFMKHRSQFIVAHPCNPPYHTPMVELVPAPWTSEGTRSGARSLMQVLKILLLLQTVILDNETLNLNIFTAGFI